MRTRPSSLAATIAAFAALGVSPAEIVDLEMRRMPRRRDSGYVPERGSGARERERRLRQMERSKKR